MKVFIDIEKHATRFYKIITIIRYFSLHAYADSSTLL